MTRYLWCYLVLLLVVNGLFRDLRSLTKSQLLLANLFQGLKKLSDFYNRTCLTTRLQTADVVAMPLFIMQRVFIYLYH